MAASHSKDLRVEQEARAEAERAQKAVWAEVHGQDPSRTYTVAEVKRLVYTLDNAISALVSRPVSPATRETVTEEMVERAARSLATLEPGEDWPSNEDLGGNLTGTRDDEYRDGMRDMARAALEAALTEGRNPGCPCVTCLKARGADIWFMVVCATCGNKRCPHAENHDNPCTGSNEPGQSGATRYQLTEKGDDREA